MTPPRNGCYDGQRGDALAAHTYPAQDGWIEQPLGSAETAQGVTTRIPRIVQVPHVMTTECQYSIHTRADPKCEGCKRKAP